MNEFIEILKAVLFGIVEGITEWLPISSTGHMIILEQWLKIEESQSTAFYDFFLVIIQFGAIIAVLLEFFKKLWPFGKAKTREEKKDIWRIWLNMLIASIPAGIVELVLGDKIDTYLFTFLTVSITLIVYGVFFILVEVWLKKKQEDYVEKGLIDQGEKLYKKDDVRFLTWKDALIIGFAQVLALIPGTSRSGVTIIAALLLSCSRSTAAEFSFFLSIPAMIAGSFYKGLKFFKGGNNLTTIQLVMILVGCLIALLVSVFVIKAFMKLLKSKTFTGFGIYRIVFGLFLLIIFLSVIKPEQDSSSALAFFSSIQNNHYFLPFLDK